MNDQSADAIIIGSGIGGLTAAAALAKCGRRVLVLERHFQLGGLTQAFARGEYSFATGVHYIGGVGGEPGQDGQFGRMLDWLSDGRLRFAPVGSPYDIVRFPGFEFPIEAPRDAFVARLKSTFPEDLAAIDAWFATCSEAQRALQWVFTSRSLPAPLGVALGWLNKARFRRALAATVADAIRAILDPRLAALLAARWGDYGVPPARAPLAVHAMVLGSYFAGAYYPVGGPAQFALALAESIRAAGGELRVDAGVTGILLADGHAAGVHLASGESIAAPVVISDMGARNTVAALPSDVAPDWRTAVESLQSGISYVSLFIGFHGDIRGCGATSANVWVYESDEVSRLWGRPTEEDAPALFVTFPSLKDPAHTKAQRHTAEVVAFARWEPFAAWAGSAPGRRPEEYAAAKSWISENMLAQFKRHFPELAPLVDFHELSTPLSQATFVGAHRGAAYGIELSAERLGSDALGVRTPVPGLFLAGQDAMSPGVQGAFMGGFAAAAAVDPRLWKEMAMRARG
jgi:all-trans-retinol 13,14-reductase